MARKKKQREKKGPFKDLTDKTYYFLSASVIETIDQLAAFHPDDTDGEGILKYRGAGKKTFAELTAFLKQHGRDWKKREKK